MEELYFELGLGTRLRRLIETMSGGLESLYEDKNIPFKSGYFYAFYAVVKRGPLTINEIASLAGFSHSAVSQTIKKLVALGHMETRATEDGRQKCVHLTPQGRALHTEMQPYWNAMEQVVKEAIRESEVDFMRGLSGIEAAFNRTSVRDRLQSKLEKKVVSGTFEIVPYDARWRDAFKNLNIWWLEAYFEVEPIDQKVLSDPEGYILDKGGEIFFAVQDGKAVGTVAMKLERPGVFELTKLGVDPSVQKGGMGRALCQKVMERFNARGGSTLFLETSTKLTGAIRLYETLDFVELPNPKADSPYARSDYYMEWRGQKL